MSAEKQATRLHIAMQMTYLGRSFCLHVSSLIEERLLTHAAACCSLLGFGYVTKPKIESSFTAKQGKRFKFINSNNKGQHYTGFSWVGVGRENACFIKEKEWSDTGRGWDQETSIHCGELGLFPILAPLTLCNCVTSFRTWESSWATGDSVPEMSLKLSDWKQFSEPNPFSLSF